MPASRIVLHALERTRGVVFGGRRRESMSQLKPALAPFAWPFNFRVSRR